MLTGLLIAVIGVEYLGLAMMIGILRVTKFSLLSSLLLFGLMLSRHGIGKLASYTQVRLLMALTAMSITSFAYAFVKTYVLDTVITQIGTSAAAYLFVSNLSSGLGQIDPGQTSSVLLMSSPQSYRFTTANVIDSGLGATGALPTPGPGDAVIPEPAALWTWLGLTMLGGMVARYCNRSKNHSGPVV